MRVPESLPSILPIAGLAAQVHDRLNPHHILIFSIDHGKREAAAICSPERLFERTANPRIISDQAQDTLDFAEEL